MGRTASNTRRPKRRLRHVGFVGGVVGALAAACYVSAPGNPAPEPGMRVVLELNDQGRVALMSNLGPEVLTVSGRFLDASDTAYRLTVAHTETLDRRRTQWGGETVSVNRDYVRRVTERRLSKPRTALAMLALVAASVVLLTRDLLGFGDANRPPDDGNGNTQ